MNQMIAAFACSTHEEIRAYSLKGKKENLIDIRVYTELVPGAEKVPTGQGFTITLSQRPQLQQLMEQLKTFQA